MLRSAFSSRNPHWLFHAGLLGCVLLFSAGGHGQMQQPAPRYSPLDAPSDNGDLLNRRMDAAGPSDQKLVRMLNTARQRAMVADADKLLELARELDQEIAASKSAALTPSELRKVARIEKLAHNVRVEMCVATLPSPNDQDPYSVVRRFPIPIW